jgi:hypothetical protein
VLDGFPERPGEPLTQARFTHVPTFSPAPGARVLLRFDDAHAALVEAPRVLVLATPLDAARSDFALSGAFLPLVHQAARVLARGTAAPSLHPGDSWSAPARRVARETRPTRHPGECGDERGATRGERAAERTASIARSRTRPAGEFRRSRPAEGDLRRCRMPAMAVPRRPRPAVARGRRPGVARARGSASGASCGRSSSRFRPLLFVESAIGRWGCRAGVGSGAETAALVVLDLTPCGSASGFST